MADPGPCRLLDSPRNRSPTASVAGPTFDPGELAGRERIRYHRYREGHRRDSRGRAARPGELCTVGLCTVGTVWTYLPAMSRERRLGVDTQDQQRRLRSFKEENDSMNETSGGLLAKGHPGASTVHIFEAVS
jgi:hypothetical protein